MLKKDTLDICFHKPRNLVGHLISIWTVGKYSHCEFIFNNKVYLANPGGVREQPFIRKENFDIYEVVGFNVQEILDFFEITKGSPYDYPGIFGQLFYFLNVQDDDKYFCSEWCLNALDYAADYKLNWRNKKIKEKGYHKFNPQRLYKYLKSQYFIKEVI